MKDLIGENLSNVIKDKDLKEVSIDILESIIDSKFNDGIIKDIPILSTIFGAYKVVNNIGEVLFIKKLLYFLNELRTIPLEKRNEQISKIEDNAKYRTKVGEKLLHIIDKLDDIDKASLVGKFFRVYLESKIDYDSFVRGVMCIDRTPLPDLLYFINNDFDRKDLDQDIEFSQYLTYGLMKIIVVPPKIKITKSQQSFTEKLDYKIVDFSAKAFVNTDGKNIREYLRESTK